MANTAEEDEWEYEYDENETEDFYIPLDLSNVPEAQGPMNILPKQGHPTLLKSRLRALNAIRREAESAADSSDAQESATMGEVQIIGLHTPNPLVMYNGQLLSCQWTSTIGTDMFFIKPGSEEQRLIQPLRKLPAVDLLGTGSAKLVARVGRLRPRGYFSEDQDNDQLTAAPMDTHESSQPVSTESSYSPAETSSPTGLATSPAPSNFLARLNQAKAKRGESSRLVVSQGSNGFCLLSKEVLPESSQNGDRPQQAEDIVMADT